jgi:heme-degrading monooxygenase HmoA
MPRLILAAALFSLTALLSGCAYTAPYRRASLAKSGALPPDHLAVVTLTATEIKPGQRGPFFQDTRRVLDALPDQEGLLGHAFRFELFGDEAWTITAWRDEAARDAFVRSPEHLAAMRRSRQTAQNLRFVTLRLPISELPPRWRDVLPLLAATPPRAKPNVRNTNIAPSPPASEALSAPPASVR